MKSLLAFLTSASLLVASAQAEVTLVYKGNVVPHDGFLFTREDADLVRIDRLERDMLKEKSASLERSLDLQTKNLELSNNSVDLLMKRNDHLSQALQEGRVTTTIERVTWFALGVLATGLAFYGAQTISSR